jgi:hypothetical protein
MRKFYAVVFYGMLSAPGVVLAAEADLEALKRELHELRERTEQLERKLQAMDTSAGGTNASPSAAPTTAPSGGAQEPVRRWSPADPIQIGAAQKFVNVSLNVLTAVGGSTGEDVEDLQLGGHDPSQRGFTLQQAELTLEGRIDPYLRGQANTVLFLDSGGETQVELEEAYLETMSLPWNLQLKGGHFLTEFGRLNPTHPHTWDFVDSPLVNAHLLGPDGLRNPGARLSWLAPTPWYTELFLAVQNSHGGTAHGFRSAGHVHGGEEEEEEGLPFGFRHPDNDRGLRNVGDLLFAPRYVMSFEPTANQVVLLGGSAAFGPNSNGGEDAGETETQIYGADLTWKWKSPQHHGGFPFVAFQTEAMLRKFDAGAFDWDEDGNGAVSPGEVVDETTGHPAVLAGETLTDYGIYAQLLYGFRKGWVAGLRGDWIGSDEGDYEEMPLSLEGEPLGRDPLRAKRWRVSPNLTWYPSEFSKVRLQYNYDHRNELNKDDHSVWLQFEFLLGAHAAHKF